jgi:hypothetical protein
MSEPPITFYDMAFGTYVSSKKAELCKWHLYLCPYYWSLEIYINTHLAPYLGLYFTLLSPKSMFRKRDGSVK